MSQFRSTRTSGPSREARLDPAALRIRRRAADALPLAVGQDPGVARFLLSAMPFTGHVAPVAAVAAELAGRGHDVRLYTGGAFQDVAERAGARLVPWHAAPDFDEHDLSASFPRLVGRKGIAQLLVNMEDLFIGTGPAQVQDLAGEWEREPWDLLVADEASIGPRLVAERLRCRWATITVLPLYLPSAQGPPSGLGLQPGAGPILRLRDALLRAVVPLLGRPLRLPVARARAAAGLPPSHEDFGTAVLSPELVLASGVPALDHGRTDRPEHLHWVGSLRSTAPSTGSLPSWWGDLDGRRVVVVTQGTQNTDPEDLLAPATRALADLDAVVVALTGRAGSDALPFAVPPNVRVAGFVPFDELLPRTHVLVTNGGWGGTLAALALGVPLVVAGGDLDKPEVAARVASSGAGIDLGTGRPKPAAVRAAVDRVDADPSYRAHARRAAVALARAGGAERAADLLEQHATRG
jgi:UDP:flavonoid glycosyltransferase YjiC (YdhE family)